jgi:hypothetical protein
MLVTGSVADHIEASSGRVKARCVIAAPISVMSSSCCVSIDRAVWLVEP